MLCLLLWRRCFMTLTQALWLYPAAATGCITVLKQTSVTLVVGAQVLPDAG
jgi:hypothetical protein